MEMNCAKYFVSLVCIALAASSETTNDTSLDNCSQKAAWSVYMDVAADMIGKVKNSSITGHDTDGKCGLKEALMSYLEFADEMINKAKNIFPTCDNCNISKQQILDCSDLLHRSHNCNTSKQQILDSSDLLHRGHNCNTSKQQILDCSDLLHMGHNRNGVYTIWPIKILTEKKSIDVYCDMETDGGGWTVIQRRGDFQNPVDYFDKDWKSYKEGFGDVEKEFWLGNDNIFALTNQGIYSVRFDLEDAESKRRYAQYETFLIDDESSKYTLHISKYSGNAGDSMRYSNNLKFSTKDQDSDGYEEANCAQAYKGAWWMNQCYYANLNGENLKGKNDGLGKGKIWITWKGNMESLASTEIKIRPKNFRA